MFFGQIAEVSRRVESVKKLISSVNEGVIRKLTGNGIIGMIPGKNIKRTRIRRCEAQVLFFRPMFISYSTRTNFVKPSFVSFMSLNTHRKIHNKVPVVIQGKPE